MRLVRQVWLTLRATLRKPQVEREMEDELAEHLESEVRELMAGGMAEPEARRRARATMGPVELIREECRDSRGTAAWEHLKQDAAFGLRLLAKNRMFSTIALITMALGIGSTTAVFSLIDGVFLRPLPFPEPDRLFAADAEMRGPFDILRANSRLADYAAEAGVRPFNVMGQERPEPINGGIVSSNFFQVLGVHPSGGRAFAEGEDRPGKLREVILSHEFRVQRFPGGRDAVGQILRLDEAPFEVVGVMPAGFQYPPMRDAKFWVPMRLDPRNVGEYWGSGGTMAIARLHAGVSPDAARAELRTWIPRIRAMFPWRMPDAWGQGAGMTELREHLVAGAKLRSLLLLAVAVLVLLIAIVNVANLMIAQTAARQREIAMRASLGATPGRLARQLLTEALMLASVGGILGTALAFAELAWLKHLLPADMPRLAEVAIDGRILAFTGAMALGSGVLFGLLPAWRVGRQRSLAAMESGRTTLGAVGSRTDSLLIMTEAAFAAILLVGAGLLLRSLWNMVHVDPGFRVASVVTAELSPGREASASWEKTIPVYERIRARLSAYPGVAGVAAVSELPLTPDVSAFTAAIEDHPRPPQEPQYPLWCTAVAPEAFDTLGMRLLQGRGFTEADSAKAPRVVLISRSTAQRYWPGKNPIGRHLRPVWVQEWRTIVGVVDDVKNYGINGPPEWVEGEVYVPFAQAAEAALPRTISLVARLAIAPAPFEKALPSMVQEVCSNCAVSKIARMESLVSDAVEAPRSTAWLVGGFALLALGLAAAGIYGVVSHAVLRRTRELGVHLALGAGRGRVAWLVVSSSIGWTMAGAFAGLAASWLLARWVESLLFGVAAHDAVSFAATPVALCVAAMLASLPPMWRAVRIDPARTLRE
jgi:putative ABC transport system permease protein